MEVSKMLSVIIIITSVLVMTMVNGEQIVIEHNQNSVIVNENNVFVNEMKHVIGKRSYASNKCHASHMQKALSLVELCSPRETVIPIPLFNVSATAQITPTHVSVKRCDGGCNQYGHACLPLAVKIVQIPIMVAQCGIDSGICDKDCAMVEIEEHTACSCACELTAASCAANQDYRQELCSCQCHDVLGRQECLDSGRVWDERSCSCGCTLKSMKQNCPYGELFSDQACTCIPESEVALMLDNTGTQTSDSKDDLFDKFSLEHILILVLATIILILLAILATLCSKIRSMSRRIRQNHPMSGGRVGNGGHLLADSDLDVKQLHPGNPVYREGSCSTPSSGFYSEIAANERNYQQQGGKRESDSMYHSAESVRLKKQRLEGFVVGGGDQMVLRENELALREEGLETSSSVSRSRINIIENVLVGEDEGFIRFCPDDNINDYSTMPPPMRMHAMEIDTAAGSRLSPAMPPRPMENINAEYGTVKRPKPRLLIEEPMAPLGDGSVYGRIRLDSHYTSTIVNSVNGESTMGSLKKVKPPIPPPKSPRIFSHVVGSSNQNGGFQNGGSNQNGDCYPSPHMNTTQMDQSVTLSDAQCQLKAAGGGNYVASPGNNKSGNNFANPHIDEALRLLQESANNL